MGLLDQLLANFQGGNTLGMPGARDPMPFDPSMAGVTPGAQPVDPYAEADAEAAKKKATQFGPFPGMLNAPYRMAGGPGSGPLDLPPSTNDPQAQEPEVFKDGVPLPRPRPDSGLNGQDGGGAGEPAGAPLSLAPPNPSDSAELPPAAVPAGPATTSGGGLGDIGTGLKSVIGKIFDPNKAATWMALGSGFAGAPSIGQGISRASAAAIPAMAADRANELKQTGIASTYRALVARGVPPAEALAAVYNPDVMKATAAKYFETKALTPHTVTDAFGGQSMVVFNPNTGQFMQNGQPVGAGAPGTPGGQKEYLAKGVTDVNHDLIGDDYVNQFSPEVKQAVKDYVAGRSTPTGNPRKGFTQQIKLIASKYGNDIGLPADDTSFAARRTMRNQLSSATPGSVGGQRNSGNVMIGHLATVAERAHSLGNWDTGVFPDLAHAINWTREHGSTAQAAKANGLMDAVQRYVAEVEKYYAGGVGAQSARDAAEKRFASVKTPAEFAEAIKAERHLAQSKLQTVDGQIKTVLGPLASEYPAITPASEKYLGQIDKTVALLEGRSGSSSAAPAAPIAPLAPGQTTTIGGVKIRRID